MGSAPVLTTNALHLVRANSISYAQIPSLNSDVAALAGATDSRLRKMLAERDLSLIYDALGGDLAVELHQTLRHF